ncbi:DUF1634 domain-containing protein [Rhodococcus erythropolis]|uniref:DUF1634 domain-containing protein n=1 Tax=Rhodococcus erythropolis TaxID=1833 RepID=UPI00294929B5|nr:DUF1634 domain-containing protein [Rhodococcus erythropolis]MDV6275528.1 DUF1634 domain-containing protein [Rhodococcus erythropolis]
MRAPTSEGTLHSRLACVLQRGTLVAVTVTAVGMAAGFTTAHLLATVATMFGLLMFALLPVAVLVVAAHHFARKRDRTYLVLTAGVLVVVAANMLVGSAL